jgi:hypothetical protein
MRSGVPAARRSTRRRRPAKANCPELARVLDNVLRRGDVIPALSLVSLRQPIGRGQAGRGRQSRARPPYPSSAGIMPRG